MATKVTRESIWQHATFQSSIITLATKNQVWICFSLSKKFQLRSVSAELSAAKFQIQCHLENCNHMGVFHRKVSSCAGCLGLKHSGPISVVPSWHNTPNAIPTPWLRANWSDCIKNIYLSFLNIYSQLKNKTINPINMVQIKSPPVVINPSLNQNKKVT